MKKFVLFIAIAVVFAFMSDFGLAQCPMAAKGKGPDANKCARMYDSATVQTLKGEVVAVDELPCCGNTGIHLSLKTETETIPVHLGPSWYLEKQDTQIAKNDQIEVKGSRTSLDGKEIVIASEITKGDQLLKLRDDSGFPLWSGGRKRQ